MGKVSRRRSGAALPFLRTLPVFFSPPLPLPSLALLQAPSAALQGAAGTSAASLPAGKRKNHIHAQVIADTADFPSSPGRRASRLRFGRRRRGGHDASQGSRTPFCPRSPSQLSQDSGFHLCLSVAQSVTFHTSGTKNNAPY